MENHPIPPVYDKNSKILILGSFPSVKSREMKFFYGHPQNRFWKVLAGLTRSECPQTIEEKREFLIHNHIAVWDVIKSCDIIGSSDSSIKNVSVNDIKNIIENSDIKAVFTNGGTAHKLYKKYMDCDYEAVKLPSTSPAKAAYSLDKLINEWKVILDYL